MKTRFGAPRGRARATMALGAAYVFFILSPHFETLAHRHAHGDVPHHHAFLSAHDVALERALLTAGLPGLGDLSPQGEIAPAGPSTDSPPLSLPPGTHGIESSEWAMHSHGQEDPNLVALGSPVPEIALAFAPLPRREEPVAPATEREAVRASARAPPSYRANIIRPYNVGAPVA